MNIVNVQQGSKEWHDLRAKHFTASEAPAMMGDSKYQSRSELLQQKATGITREIAPAQQRLFDRGHKTEEMARPIVEGSIGDELFPATATDEIDGLSLLASFDGITMLEDTVFEHKLWSEKLADQVRNNDLEPHYYWQLEQQLLISGAGKVIFVCSDGTSDKLVRMEYMPIPGRANQLLAGWAQFAADLDTYVPQVEEVKAEAKAIRGLPAIAYQLDGLALTSNIEAYKTAADQLVEASKKPLETDQDFADCEQMCKVFKEAEGKLKHMQEAVIGEVADIDTFTKDLAYIGEQLRQARLAGEKQVKTRKEELKREIVTSAGLELTNHINELNVGLDDVNIPWVEADFAGAIKGKRTVKSLKDAAADELAKAKIEANRISGQITDNLNVLTDLADDFRFLFSDLQQIITKDTDDFEALVKTRVADHKQAEADRLQREKEEEEENARIAEQAQEDAATVRQDELLAKENETDIASGPAALEPVRPEGEQAANEEEEEEEQSADHNHRATINSSAMQALVNGGVSEECAKAVIVLIARGEVPNITISY